MGKTIRNWKDSESDGRNSRQAKKHSKLKKIGNRNTRSKLKNDYINYEEDL